MSLAIDTTKGCEWCGNGVTHIGVCPKVKSITYGQDGRIEKVEFFSPADYPPIGLSHPFVVGAPPMPRNF